MKQFQQIKAELEAGLLLQNRYSFPDPNDRINIDNRKRLDCLDEYVAYDVAAEIIQLIQAIMDLTDSINTDDYKQLLLYNKDSKHTFFDDSWNWSREKRLIVEISRKLGFTEDEFNLLFSDITPNKNFSFNDLHDRFANFINNKIGTEIPTSEEGLIVKDCSTFYDEIIWGVPHYKYIAKESEEWYNEYILLYSKCGISGYDIINGDIKGKYIDIVTTYHRLLDQSKNEEEALKKLIELLYRIGFTIHNGWYRSGMLSDNERYNELKEQLSKSK